MWAGWKASVHSLPPKTEKHIGTQPGYLESTKCQLICLLTRRTSPDGKENLAGLKKKKKKTISLIQNIHLAVLEIHKPGDVLLKQPSTIRDTLADRYE